MNTLGPLHEIALFEFYAKNIWPIHRLFAKNYLSPRCTQCCVSSKFSPRNKEGVCELCTSQETTSIYKISDEHQKQLEHDLNEVIKSYEEKGEHDYDAIVMISGGKDSTLLLHRLRTDYPKLRILTLTIDNTFMSPVALNNIQQVVKKLQVPNITYRPDPEIFNQAFSYAFTHLGDKGCAQTVDTVDGDIFISIGKNMAAKLKIPLLFIGLSFEQVDRYLHWNSFENQDYQKIPQTRVGDFATSDLVEEKFSSIWWNPSKVEEHHIPRVICPFYVWRMSEIEIKEKTAALGILTKKEVSPLLTNNALIPLCGLVDIAHLGYSSWEPEFSRMIREGKTDKELWQSIFELLEYSAKTGRFISSSVDEVLSRLTLTREALGVKRR